MLEQNKTDLQTAIKQAKSKILDLAIHGKLVPQDTNDEPASVLLEKIRAEKEAKIEKIFAILDRISSELGADI